MSSKVQRIDAVKLTSTMISICTCMYSSKSGNIKKYESVEKHINFITLAIKNLHIYIIYAIAINKFSELSFHTHPVYLI